MNTPDSWLHSSIHKPHKGSPKILCIHGFIGSPFDFKPLVDKIEDHFDIFIPKLDVPIESGENTYLQAMEHFMQYKPDIVIGFSMGGAIAMQLPSCIKVIIAPFQGLPYGNKTLSILASSFSFLNPTIPKLQSGRIKSKEGKRKYKPGQWSFSTASFLALQELVSKPRYTKILAPLLWIHSPKDPVACYKKARERWGEDSKHLCIEDAEHVLLYEEQIDVISQEIQLFLFKHVKKSHT